MTKSERLVVLVDEATKERLAAVAESDVAFYTQGHPSVARVVRAALELFFAERGRQIDQMCEQTNIEQVAA